MRRSKEAKKRRAAGWVVLAAGIVCALVGAAEGQAADVFRKAIFVCMECIGIG